MSYHLTEANLRRLAVNIDDLKQRFGGDSALTFEHGEGGLPRVRISTAAGEAMAYGHGAHLTHWQPRGHAPVLFMSSASQFAQGQPIRGGVPVCYPWFGPRPDQPDAPAHGLVRTQAWELIDAGVNDDGTARLAFSFHSSSLSQPWFAGEYEVICRMSFGEALTLSLETANHGDQPISITEALHTYFHVKDIEQVTLDGFGGASYHDKVAAGKLTEQVDDPMRFAGETDRAFLGHTQASCINDPGLHRRIHITKAGSQSSVVWNPWVDRAKIMPDLGDDDWRTFLCVEAANALSDAVTIEPGGTHAISQTIRVEAMS